MSTGESPPAPTACSPGIDATPFARQKQFPDQVAHALVLERLSLAMNPRGRLYKKEPLYRIVSKSGNIVALEGFRTRFESVPWAVYRVRRIYQPKALFEGKGRSRRFVAYDQSRKGNVQRCVEKTNEFPDSASALEHLHHLALQNSFEAHVLHELSYVTVSRCGNTYPTTEEYYVAAPALVSTKARYGVPRFDEEATWPTFYCGQDDLSPLFAGI